MTKFPMTAAGYSALQDELNQRMAVNTAEKRDELASLHVPPVKVRRSAMLNHNRLRLEEWHRTGLKC